VLLFSFATPCKARKVLKQTIKPFYVWIVPIHPRLQGEAFPAPAGKNYCSSNTNYFLEVQ
jgi:hypothetical protein